MWPHPASSVNGSQRPHSSREKKKPKNASYGWGPGHFPLPYYGYGPLIPMAVPHYPMPPVLTKKSRKSRRDSDQASSASSSQSESEWSGDEDDFVRVKEDRNEQHDTGKY